MKVFSSFRDPQGKVIVTKNQVWRLVFSDGISQLNEFLALDLADKWQEESQLVKTSPASQDEIIGFQKDFAGISENLPVDFALFKHHPVNFPSFPYEWSPEMLFAAGNLTLDFAEKLLPKGWGLKDATPFNILFDGARPVFIDVLSFEKRNPLDPIWLAYNQFTNTFLLPLLVNKELNIPLKFIFQTNREGLDISEAAGFFKFPQKLSPKILTLITLPNSLAKRAANNAGIYQKQNLKSADQAEFILRHSFRRLRRQLSKVAPKTNQQTKWTDYTTQNQEKIPQYMQAKQNFVVETVKQEKPRQVLDIGCNTGFFSFSAAGAGANVVALDHDPAVVGRVWQTAFRENLKVLPLVVDLARPSPSFGWRNAETPSFLDRAVGKFDFVMMLAVLHHLLVQERIPLHEVLQLAADLTTDILMIEFVPQGDPLFKQLARGRDYLHQDLTKELFEQTAGKFFKIVRSQQLPQSERWVYLMKKTK